MFFDPSFNERSKNLLVFQENGVFYQELYHDNTDLTMDKTTETPFFQEKRRADAPPSERGKGGEAPTRENQTGRVRVCRRP